MSLFINEYEVNRCRTIPRRRVDPYGVQPAFERPNSRLDVRRMLGGRSRGLVMAPEDSKRCRGHDEQGSCIHEALPSVRSFPARGAQMVRDVCRDGPSAQGPVKL